MIEWRLLQPGNGSFSARRKTDRRVAELRPSRAFTILELLVVMAVMTILVAVLVPVFWSARNRAHSATCINNLHQLGFAAQLYASESDDTLPDAPGDPTAGSASAALARSGVLSFQQLLNLMPTQGSYVRMALTQTDPALKPETFQCPNDSGTDSLGFSKHEPVYKSALTSYLWDPDQLPFVGGPSVNGASLSALDDPATARLMQDYGVLWHARLGSKTAEKSDGSIHVVNQGFVNILFADNHVKSLPTEEILASATGASANPTLVPGSAPTAASRMDQTAPFRHRPAGPPLPRSVGPK